MDKYKNASTRKMKSCNQDSQVVKNRWIALRQLDIFNILKKCNFYVMFCISYLQINEIKIDSNKSDKNQKEGHKYRNNRVVAN